MSILIKGMEMPYGCANCPFCSAPMYDSKGFATYSCNVDVEGIRGKNNTSEVIAMYEGAEESFPEWCPLTELPDGHGRLIDANALMNDGWTLHKQVMRMGSYAIHEMPLDNPNVSIVIPADKDGET